MTTGTITDKIPIPETPTASNHDVALFVAFKDRIKTELEDTGLLPVGELICELSDGKIFFKSSSERTVEELLEIVRKNTNLIGDTKELKSPRKLEVYKPANRKERRAMEKAQRSKRNKNG